MFGPRSSILDTIGRTPVVRINKLAPASIELYAKLPRHRAADCRRNRLVGQGVVKETQRQDDPGYGAALGLFS